MDKVTEFKRTVADFNYTCSRLKKAEEYFETCTLEQYEKFLPLYHSILRDSSKVRSVLEKMLGRELTNSECINGYEM